MYQALFLDSRLARYICMYMVHINRGEGRGGDLIIRPKVALQIEYKKVPLKM